MTTLADLRSAIITQVSAVSNIGSVNNRERFAADRAKFLEQFGATIASQRQVRGWVVTLERISAVPDQFGAIERTYHWLLYGLLGLKDASSTEHTFLDLVETLMDTLDDESTLGVAGVVVHSVGPCQLRLHQIRQFQSDNVHYCEIEYPVRVVKTI